MTETDISSEEYRLYTYPDGSKFRIEAPLRVFVTESGSHRVIDAAGLTHRPTPGYIGLTWKSRPGEPAFVV